MAGSMQRRKAYVQVTEWCLVRIGPAGAGDVHLPAPAQLKAPARLPRVLAEGGPLPLDTLLGAVTRCSPPPTVTGSRRAARVGSG